MTGFRRGWLLGKRLLSTASEIEEYITSHPYVQELRQDSKLKERRNVNAVSDSSKAFHLSQSSLAGPDRIVVPPYCWTDYGDRLFAVMYLGSKLAGHKQVVHGGLLAV